MSFFDDLREKVSALFQKGVNVASKGIDVAGKRMVAEAFKIADKFDDPEIVANRPKYGTCENILVLQTKVRKKYVNERMKKLTDAFKNNKDEKGLELTATERGCIAEIIKKARQIQQIDKTNPEEKVFDMSLDDAIKEMNNVIRESRERERKKAEKKKK